jgi:mRNA interferase MazF
MEINQYDIFLVSLDPTPGPETQNVKPCVVISPNEINHYIKTVIIAPITTKSQNYPTRIKFEFQNIESWIILEQIKAITKIRLLEKLGSIEGITIRKVKETIKEMLVD